MNPSRHKRAALLFFVVLAVIIAAPAVLTWQQVRKERLNRALIAVVKRNDDRAVVTLLNQGADANCRDEPPRDFSLWQTFTQVLLGRPSRTPHALTPLLIALASRKQPYRPGFDYAPENVPLVRVLLDHKAQVNQTDADGKTPLEWAIRSGKNATVRLMLSRGVNANVRYEQGSLDTNYAPLVWAAEHKSIELGVIADLLDHGVNVNQQDAPGYTALYMATMFARVDVVRLLLNRHADTRLPGWGDQMPLARALWDKSPEGKQILHLLRQAGAKK